MTCSYCHQVIGSTFIGVGTGDGRDYAHPRCYYLANPYKDKADLAHVLCNSEDMVLARQLVVELTDQAIADEIVKRFNAAMRDRYERRIAA